MKDVCITNIHVENILCEKHHISEHTIKVVKLGDKEYAIIK